MKSRYLLIGLTEEDKQKIRELTEEKGGQKKAVGKSGKKSGKKKVVRKSGKKTIDRVWTLLQERPQSTFADMVRVLGLTRSTIQKHIANLKAAGRLRRVGPDKGGHWEVIEEWK